VSNNLFQRNRGGPPRVQARNAENKRKRKANTQPKRKKRQHHHQTQHTEHKKRKNGKTGNAITFRGSKKMAIILLLAIYITTLFLLRDIKSRWLYIVKSLSQGKK